jgi:hypothetical protein
MSHSFGLLSEVARRPPTPLPVVDVAPFKEGGESPFVGMLKVEAA